MRINRLVVLIVIAATLPLNPPGARPKLNLVLVTLDTTRADRIGAYGDARAVATPAFDRLAREGVLFEDVTSPVPLTLPAHCSLFTGRLPPRHGVRENASRLDSATPTLASVLLSRGYRTAAFVAADVLARSHGLYVGFDVYDDHMSPSQTQEHRPRRGADSVVDRAVSWIESAKASPFFLWVHFYDAHAPYQVLPPFDRMYPGRPYEAAIASIDAQVARLRASLDQNGLTARTVIVVIGDHGEALGEHRERSHGLFVYQSVLRVPFIIRAPEAALQGRRVRTAVSSVDLMPTVLEMLRIETAIDVDGRSLVPVILQPEPNGPADVYAENLYVRRRFGWSEMRAIRSGAWKLIDKTSPELYDLEHDPSEVHDLSSGRPEVAARLARRLRAWNAKLTAGITSRDLSAPTLNHDVRLRLASLGYVASTPSETLVGETPAADPRDYVEVFNRLTAPCASVSTSQPCTPSPHER